MAVFLWYWFFFFLFARPQAGFDPGYSGKYRYLVGRPGSDGRRHDGGCSQSFIGTLFVGEISRVGRRLGSAPSSQTPPAERVP